MKAFLKLLVAGLFSASVGVGAALGAHAPYKEATRMGEAGTYQVSKCGRTLTADKGDLSFTVRDEATGTLWSSVDLGDEEGITASRKAFLKSPLTVYFLTLKAGNGSFSAFDKAHEAKTRVDFRPLDDGFAATLHVLDGSSVNTNILLDVSYEIVLNEVGIRLTVTEVKEDTENENNRVARLVFYPAFASSKGLVDGYLLIPDGSGAVVDLSRRTIARTPIELSVYDTDIGVMDNKRSPTTSEILSLPMFARSEQGRSTLAHVDRDEEYAVLNAKAAGIIDDFNLAYYSFVYRDIYYRYQGIGELTKVPNPQVNANVCLPEITYELYPGRLEYYDFAGFYREHLVGSGLLDKAQALGGDVRLAFLMADSAGTLFGRETVVMTTAKFVREKAEALLDKGVTPAISVMGARKGGLTDSYPRIFPLEKKTGSEADYRELFSYLKEHGFRGSFVADVTRSYQNNGIPRKELAMNMSEKYISALDYQPGSSLVFDHLTRKAAAKYLDEAVKESGRYEGADLDLLSLGNKLFSSYFNEDLSRSEAKKMNADLLRGLERKPALRKPNQYLYKDSDSYLEMPRSSSGFLLETESVPFLPMLLSGLKAMYSAPLNLNYLGESNLLSLVDYDVNPSFLLTEKSAIELLHTASDHVFASQYANWEEDVVKAYESVSAKLAQVAGARFLSRAALQEGVYADLYDNGKKIIVNYSASPADVDGVTVEARSSEVLPA